MFIAAPPETLQPSAASRYRVVLAGVFALVLTVGLARFAYTPMLPIMAAQAQLSPLAAGWLAAINYAGYMSGTLLAASISNLHTKYLLYRVGLVVAVLSTAAMGLTDNVITWAVLRYLSGLSSIGGMLLASGLVLNWLIRHGHRPELGLHFAGLGLGIAVSGLSVALSAPLLAWHGQWIALGALGAILLWPAWAWLPPPASVHKGGTATPTSTSAPSGRWMTLSMASYFCAGFGFAIGATFIVAILEKLPALSGLGGWIWVGVGLAAVPSTFLWDRIAGALGTVRALLLAYGLQLVSLILPAVSHGLMPNLAAALLFGGTFAGIVSLTLTLIGRHFPANPAKAMARMTLSYGVAQIIAPAMAGSIAKATGSYGGALIVAAGVMTLGLFVLQALAREESRNS